MVWKRDVSVLILGSPGTSDPLELAYCIMREAESQPVTEDGRITAMRFHEWLYDLGMEHRSVADSLWAFNPRVGTNQRRLGIT